MWELSSLLIKIENYSESHFIKYIYENYMKISWNTINWISSKDIPFGLNLDIKTTSESPAGSLIKLINATVILKGSSLLVLLRELVVLRSNVPHTYLSRRLHFGEWSDQMFGVIYILTNPSAGLGYETGSFLKRSLTGLISEFSFS